MVICSSDFFIFQEDGEEAACRTPTSSVTTTLHVCISVIRFKRVSHSMLITTL